jgi:hypothetical protein
LTLPPERNLSGAFRPVQRPNPDDDTIALAFPKGEAAQMRHQAVSARSSGATSKKFGFAAVRDGVAA